MKTTLSAKQQFWKDHIKQALSEKVSLTDYAKQHNLDLKALYNYKSILLKKGALPETASAFAKAKIVSKPEALMPMPVHVRFPNGVVLELPNANADTLASLMALR